MSSTSSQIMDYLVATPTEKLKHVTSTDIAAAIGQPNGTVSKLLWSMENAGRIRLIRSGRSIIGVEEIVRSEPLKVPGQGRYSRINPTTTHRRAGEQPTTLRPSGEPYTQVVRRVRTPILDSYAAAKQRAKSDTGDRWITVAFQEDPAMEEALALRETLVRLDSQYAELSVNYKKALYDLELYKARLADKSQKLFDEVSQQIAEGAAERD